MRRSQLPGCLATSGCLATFFGRGERPARVSIVLGEALRSLRGHFEAIDHLQQGIAARPAGRPTAGSSLVRRLVQAKDDPAKQRIRARLSEIDDERLFGLGLTSEDIAALRGKASPTAEATIVQGLDAPSEDSSAYQISPPIAGVLDATDEMWRHESDTSRRERVTDMPSA